MKKPKSAAKLAAEASDRLDALLDSENTELSRLALKYMADGADLHDKFRAKRAAVWASLTDEATAKLRGLRAEIVEVLDPGEDIDLSDDEPAHLRDVMP
jgi:hypothetical protein